MSGTIGPCCKGCGHDPRRSVYKTSLNVNGYCSYCQAEGIVSDETAAAKKEERERYKDSAERDDDEDDTPEGWKS